jgi:hypothetical protein
MSYTVIPELIGKYINNIEVHNNGVGNDHIDFHISDGSIYRQKHIQDCCESVTIEDIDGDIEDLIGYKLIIAEESSSNDPNTSESATWTYYKFATIKGYVTIRWYGYSNGYYSESVDICKIKDEDLKGIRKTKLIEINENKKDVIN